MPLAKVIPIVNGLIYTILADAPNPFVQVISKMLVSSVSRWFIWWHNLHCVQEPGMMLLHVVEVVVVSHI